MEIPERKRYRDEFHDDEKFAQSSCIAPLSQTDAFGDYTHSHSSHLNNFCSRFIHGALHAMQTSDKIYKSDRIFHSDENGCGKRVQNFTLRRFGNNIETNRRILRPKSFID